MIFSVAFSMSSGLPGRGPGQNTRSCADRHEGRIGDRTGGSCQIPDLSDCRPIGRRPRACSHGCMPAAELHVLPQAGNWIVGEGASSPALSRHATADQAELEAKRVGAARGARRILLHDAYQRVRAIPITPVRRGSPAA